MDVIKKVKGIFNKEETKETPSAKLEALMKEKEEATKNGEPWVAVLDTLRRPRLYAPWGATRQVENPLRWLCQSPPSPLLAYAVSTNHVGIFHYYL